MVLRDYQVEMLSRLERAWKSHRSVMVQMPTGTGKTVLMGEAIRRGSGQVLVVAHRRELIEQIRGTIAALGIPASLVRVESIQKLAREIGSGEPGNCAPSLVIVDEAHHALAKTYRMLWERWPEAKFLGLTATPCRLSGEAFTDLFEVLLESWSIREFIRKGWLSDLDYVSARPDSELVRKVAGLRKRGSDGDYQTKEMALVMDTPESIAHLYRSYRAFADGKKGIVYAINIEHARHIATYYNNMGVRCAVIDCKTSKLERARLVEAYKHLNEIEVLVNVDIFSEGFDCPEVEFIQLARPTLSLNKYLQQVGRGMRISEGKSEVTILDQVGLYLSFGLPTSERNWRAMFNGKQAGKGRPQAAASLPQDAMTAGTREKVLVNEQMVRLKMNVKETIEEVEEEEDQYPVFRGRSKNDALQIVLKWAVWCNDWLLILRGSQLALRSNPKDIMDIYGYYKDSVLVKTNKVIGLQQIMSDGSKGRFFEYPPAGITPLPNMTLLSLRKPERPKAAPPIGQRVALTIYEGEINQRLQHAWQKHNRVLVGVSAEEEMMHLTVENIRLELEKRSAARQQTVPRVLLVASSERDIPTYKALLRRYEIRCRVMSDKRTELTGPARMTLTYVDLLASRMKHMADYEPTLIIIANAELAEGAEYEEIGKRWPRSRFLGLTTWPHQQREDGSVGMFDLLLQSWDASRALRKDPYGNLFLAGYHEDRGLKVFEKNDRLGIKKDGKTVCEAKFIRIDTLDDPDYFAIATLPGKSDYKARTIIDKNGVNLKADLRGMVRELGNGIFEYDLKSPGMSIPFYWDVVGERGYYSKPDRK
ncbi:MAG: DEAD/DEAH box helicase [Prevotella sp.]|nr:DEAD/DEAH box helicase [Prevotella sp.]